jgi:hypothetical protein
MTTKNKNKVSMKARGKLTLNKETIRDLSAGDKATAVRGGVAPPPPNTRNTI